MYLLDFSALDKFLDFYDENVIVNYENKKITLHDLKEFLIDHNKSLSLNDYIVTKDGIYSEDRQILSIFDLRKNQKDDLIDL